MAEAELTVVIGKEARMLRPDQVEDVILGYTVGNDVTQVGQIPHDDKLTQVKNGDGFTPLGPWIETELGPVLDGEGRDLATTVEPTVHVASTSANLAWTVRELLVYLTSYLTLGPGDVILTGAPATSLPIEPGQDVSVAVDGIGTLTNPVIDERGQLSPAASVVQRVPWPQP
jgi:2-keto-4-pentenoate hydratase/2-oxohepta-3-ene-1,7-dioic acid hydratase in catechol pathway